MNGALLFQLAVAIGVCAWRRCRVSASTRVAVQLGVAQVSSDAWPGWREFRVARREFEDVNHAQCAFSLEPVDGAGVGEPERAPIG